MKQILERQNRSSSSEEELDELLRRQIIGQPRNFEEGRLVDIENPREFFHHSVDDFIHILKF